ncbi:MAG: hypothetical protein JOY78_20715 [Pseudonocardia sp.]|nr:hypothetical protein [Pseudonocardia sp.]
MATASIVELELVPIATTVPSIAVLYRAEHVTMVRRLALIGAPVELAEEIAHRAFARVGRSWDCLEDPLAMVRRLAVDDVLSRFRMSGKAPTRTPPRDGAPPAWAEVGGVLDPLTPAARVLAVLRIYDGLDDHSVAQLLPVPRRRDVAPVDHALALTFADAVADIRPESRLTELLGIDALASSAAGAAPLPRPRRPRPEPERASRRQKPRPPRGSSRAWVGAGAVAVVLIGLVGGHFDPSLPTQRTRAQQLRTGLTVNGVVVPGAGEGSSCLAADAVGGTGDLDPDRVAAVVAIDRRAIIALHRGATDARLTEVAGDGQIEVVVGSRRDCPDAPQAWKDIPLVFATVADVSDQAGTTRTGRFPDGTAWQVSDRPGSGLCGRLGRATAPCGSQLAPAAQLEPVRVLADAAGHRVAFGYLPPQAVTARLEASGGSLGQPAVVPDGGMFFALASGPDEHPTLVRFYNGSGAALLTLPIPDR